MIGEPDAGKPHVRFDEGVQETCGIAARLRPTLQSPRDFLLATSWYVVLLRSAATCFAAQSSIRPPGA
jgi:hypothetical protein